MRTAFLKKLDGLLTPLACLLARLAPKVRAAPTGSTLIIRPGGMGDLICAEMGLQALGFNPLDYTWLIETRSRPWAEHRGLKYLCYDAHPLSVLAKVFASHERVINTEQLFGLSQAYGILARAHGGQLVSFNTNRGAAWADLAVRYDWKDAPEIREFARIFGATPERPEIGFANFSRPRAEPASAPPLVLIAGRQSESRRLPLETWTQLIAEWRGDRNFLVAAAPEDSAFANQLAEKFPGVANRFTGNFSELCAQIARAGELFTVDGGGVHIASFYGVPAFVIFTSGRDRKWAPLAAGSRILRRHDLPCQPFTKFGQVPPCPNAFACRELDGAKPTAP